MEEYLSAVEGRTAPVVAKMLGDYQAVEPDDKAVLSYFAALQIVRVPQFRDRIEEFIARIGETVNAMMIRSRETYEDALRQAHPGRAFTPAEVDQFYAQVRDVNSYRVVANPAAALGHGLNVVPKIADLLNRMSWVIMEPAGAGNFWTSDNPLYYINPESQHPFFGHGLGAKSVEVNLPIGPRRCFLMAWSDISGPRTPIKDLRCAQQRGIAGAKRYHSAAPSRMPKRHSTLTVDSFQAGTKSVRENQRHEVHISADDLPSPERHAEFQDMIDSLREYAHREPGPGKPSGKAHGGSATSTRYAVRSWARGS